MTDRDDLEERLEALEAAFSVDTGDRPRELTIEEKRALDEVFSRDEDEGFSQSGPSWLVELHKKYSGRDDE